MKQERPYPDLTETNWFKRREVDKDSIKKGWEKIKAKWRDLGYLVETTLVPVNEIDKIQISLTHLRGYAGFLFEIEEGDVYLDVVCWENNILDLLTVDLLNETYHFLDCWTNPPENPFIGSYNEDFDLGLIDAINDGYQVNVVHNYDDDEESRAWRLVIDQLQSWGVITQLTPYSPLTNALLEDENKEWNNLVLLWGKRGYSIVLDDIFIKATEIGNSENQIVIGSQITHYATDGKTVIQNYNPSGYWNEIIKTTRAYLIKRLEREDEVVTTDY